MDDCSALDLPILKKDGRISEWVDALMLGNGFFGALLYGKNKLMFSLDRIDLWDTRPYEVSKRKDFTFDSMVNYIKNDWDKYIDVFDNCYNSPYPSKLHAGSIVLDLEIDDDTEWSLDLSDGKFKVVSSGYKLNGYIDKNKDVLVILGLHKDIKIDFSMPEYLTSNEIDGPNKGLGYEKTLFVEEGDFSYSVQKTIIDGYFGIVIYRVDYAAYVTVYKGNDDKKAIEEAKELLKEYHLYRNSFLIKHIESWREYYSTSSISIPDKELKRQYDLGRYFFGCNSSHDYPVSLQGVWTKNDGQMPPWKGDYHADINLQMSYESYMKNGNFPEGKVVIDYLWRMRHKYKENAKAFCETDGYFIPGVMSIDGQILGGWPMYSINPACGIWTAKAFDDYYRYTGDIDFLREYVFPFLSEVEKNISGLMERYGGLPFHSSPELGDNSKDSIFPTQSNFETGLLNYLYRTLSEYCSILGIEDKYKDKNWEYSINDKGEMRICESKDYSESHRHFSHILSEKNLENLTPFENYDQICRDFEVLEKYGTSEWVAFSFTEMSQFASYIGKGEEAYKYLDIFVKAFVNDNGFDMNEDFKHLGYSQIGSHAFTLDADIAFVKSINDMLLGTVRGVICLFPAIPQKWKDEGVSFTNLRGFNSTMISASCKDGIRFEIVNPLNKPIKIYNNLGETIKLEIDGQIRTINAKLGDIIELEDCKIVRRVAM